MLPITKPADTASSSTSTNGMLPRVTWFLFTVNLVVALYLSSVLLKPLFFRLSATWDTFSETGAPPTIGLAEFESSVATSAATGSSESSSLSEASGAAEAAKTADVATASDDASSDPSSLTTKEADAEPSAGEDKGKEATSVPRASSADVAPECNMELHTDFDGEAVRWGLDHLVESPADCCAACFEHNKVSTAGPKCNIWVYCPEPKGCFSPDIWDHKHKECWLKYDEKPKLNFQGKYDAEFRKIHTTSPEAVEWVAGVIS